MFIMPQKFAFVNGFAIDYRDTKTDYPVRLTSYGAGSDILMGRNAQGRSGVKSSASQMITVMK